MVERLDDEGFVAGSFDPVKIYDAPAVALSQMFDGEASFRSIRDTFFDPAALSPAERDSYVSDLKKSLGNNPLTNSLLDVALNPFVWLLFVTTPAAGGALAKGARTFTGLGKEIADDVGKKYFKFFTGRYSVLASLGLLNAHQYGAGTPLNSILHSMASRFSQLTREDTLTMRPFVEETLKNISKKFGVTVKSLNPNDAPVATATIDGEAVSLKEYLQKFNVYAHMHMSGMDKTVNRTEAFIAENAKVQIFKPDGKLFQEFTVSPEQSRKIAKNHNSIMRFRRLYMEAQEAGEDGTVFLKTLERLKKGRNNYLRKEFGMTEDLDWKARVDIQSVRPEAKLPYHDTEAPLRVFQKTREVLAVDEADLSGQWLRREGFMPLLDGSRQMMKRRYADMFAKRDVFDATGNIEYDDLKLTRIFRALSSDADAKTVEEMSNVLSKELGGYVGGEGYKKIIQALTPDSKGRVKMTLEQFRGLLREVQESTDDLDNYMSRNVWSYVDEAPGGPLKRRTDSIRVTAKDRSASVSGRFMTRNATDPFIDSDDLRVLQDEYRRKGLKSDYLDEKVAKSVEFETTVPPTREGGRAQVMNLDFNTSFNRYLKQTRNDLVLHVDDARTDEFIRRLIETDDPAFKQMFTAAKPGARRQFETRLLGGDEILGYSRYRLLDMASRVIASDADKIGRYGGERAREYIMGTLVNRMRGNMPMRDLLSEMATLQSMDMAASLANSKAFKAIERMGPIPEKFVKSLRNYGEMTLEDAGGSALGRGLTSVFYASHLGFNLGSAALNLMQPLMYAATWMDPDVMIKAYGSALKQYFGYIQERVKLGIRADPLKVDDLRAKHFRLSNFGTKDRPLGMDLLDIRKTDFELMDSQAFAAESALKDQGKGWVQFWGTEMPLKLFTHSELFNRTVTGEAMLGQMIKNGRLKDIQRGSDGVYRAVGGKTAFADVEAVENVREMVQNTQFGSDLINSPDLFQRTGFGVPWVRQFFTFPIRTLTAWTDTAPMVNQGRRTWGLTGFETQGRFSAMAHDFMRMMGTSAVVYEVGKNAAGIDLSRGLAGTTLYESTILGPLVMEPPSEAAYNLPLSPALSIIQDAGRILMEDDVSLLGTIGPRFIPGGIALSRALGAAPQIADRHGMLGGLQRQYADWGSINEKGQVPIYRGDGSLLEYRSAARTVLGGLGFNSYMFKTDQELNAFLVKNRQAVSNERRKYLDAILANNMGQANKIKTAFEKRFKYPLSVSKDQVDRALQLREVPLKERMYSQLSPDFRPQARPYLEERLETLKSRTPEELDLSTAAKARVLPSTFETYDPYSAVTED